MADQETIMTMKVSRPINTLEDAVYFITLVKNMTGCTIEEHNPQFLDKQGQPVTVPYHKFAEYVETWVDKADQPQVLGRAEEYHPNKDMPLSAALMYIADQFQDQ